MNPWTACCGTRVAWCLMLDADARSAILQNRIKTEWIEKLFLWLQWPWVFVNSFIRKHWNCYQRPPLCTFGSLSHIFILKLIHSKTYILQQGELVMLHKSFSLCKELFQIQSYRIFEVVRFCQTIRCRTPGPEWQTR